MIFNPFGNLFFIRGYWLKWTDNIHMLEVNTSTPILSNFAILFHSDNYRQTAQTLYASWFCGSFSIWKPGCGKFHLVFSWAVFIYNTREKVMVLFSFYSWVSQCCLHLSVHLSSSFIHVPGLDKCLDFRGLGYFLTLCCFWKSGFSRRWVDNH